MHPWLVMLSTPNLPIPQEVLRPEAQVNLKNTWTPMRNYVEKRYFQKNSYLFTYWPKCKQNAQNLNFCQPPEVNK